MDEIEKLVPLDEGKSLHQTELNFFPVKYTPAAEEPNEAYPFTLLTGTILQHFGTGTRSSRARRLKKFSPQSFVEISESDARKLAITDGEKVKVMSPVGEVTTKVKITDTLPEGTLFMPISFPETPANKLFGITLDPETKTPSLKACNVRIGRVELHG